MIKNIKIRTNKSIIVTFNSIKYEQTLKKIKKNFEIE